MKNKDKKKKPLWKRILKWSGITFLVILIALILIPILFKSQIIQLIKDEANASLNATLDFGDADLTLITTFPNLTLSIDNISVKGKGEFEDVYLAQIKNTRLKLDLWQTLFGSQYQVDEIYLTEPIFNILVLENGHANYDIAITDSTATPETAEPSPFKFALEHYQIEKGDITYDDRYYATFIHLANLEHEGNVEIDDVIYTLKTKTKSQGLTFAYDGFDYLSKSNADIKCDLELAMPENEMKITFKENDATLNALKLHFDGSMLMKDDFMDFNFTFKTLDQTFKSLLSIVPGAFTEDFNSIKTDGEIDLFGSLNGKYSETEMPGFNLTTKISNAWLQYPDLPSKLEKINLDLNIAREAGPDLDNLVIDLKSLSLKFMENKLDASLYMTNPMTDPNIKSSLATYVDLSHLKKVIPVAEGENYSGIVTSDISLKGRLSSIEKEEYEKFDAIGQLKVEAMNYSSPSLNYALAIEQMLFEFSPAALNLVTFDSKIGNSDLHADGVLSNYMAYFLKDDILDGQLNVSSNYIDLDQLMYTDETSTASSPQSSTVVSDSVPAEVFQIPNNINFSLTTKIKKMLYDSLTINNMAGNIALQDGKASLNGFNMNVFDGTILMNGDYQALNPKRAKIDFAYDIQNLDFQQSFNYFNTVQKYASFAKYCTGKFSTKMNIVAELDENYSPIYENITGLGDFNSSEVKIEDHPMLAKVAEMVKVKSLENQVIQNLKLKFEFKEGKIWMKESPIKMGKINTNISGTTSFTQELDYIWNADIPTEMLGSNVNDIASGLLAQLNEKAGTNVSIPKNLPVKFNIGGTVTKPTLISNLKETANDTKQNLIDQGKEIIKDKLSAEAKKLLEDAQKEADKILAEAKKQADALRAETELAAKKIEDEALVLHKKAKDESEKQAEQLRKEGYAASQKLIDDANNPIAKKAAEIAAKKANEETDKKVVALKAKLDKEADNSLDNANKKAATVRSEGNEKADGIESTGQAQSDKILSTANAKVDKMSE